MQQRPPASPAIAWKYRRYQIIHYGPNHPSRPPQQTRHRAFFHRPTRRRTGWPPGVKPERIVIQAFAEDSPHSPALQAIPTAP